MKRDWSAARAKVDDEGRCRVCGNGPAADVRPSARRQRLEAAHVAGREHDGTIGVHLDYGRGTVVRAVDVVPLCQLHHAAYDRRELDLLPYLTKFEQAAAVEYLGIVGAYRRLTGTRTGIS